MSLAHSTNQSLLPFSLARFTTSSPLALSHAFPQLGYASKSLLNSKLVRYGTAIFIFMKARVFLQNIFFGRSLKGEVAVITGAGSGIGKKMALDLARQGVKLALWDISESVNETAREVTEAGGTAKAYINDVSDRGSVYATAKSVLEDFGKVDILFNNAGIVSGKALLDVPDGLAEKTLQVNSISHFWTVKAFLPQMIERDHGKIVTIASAAGLVGVAGLCDYCASKYAAIGFNEALRLELRKQKKWGVSTTLVCPYYINTGENVWGGRIGRKRRLAGTVERVALRPTRSKNYGSNPVGVPETNQTNSIDKVEAGVPSFALTEHAGDSLEDMALESTGRGGGVEAVVGGELAQHFPLCRFLCN